MTTEDAIQAAARALHETTRETWEPGWGDLSEATRKRLRKEARIILQAADPHQPQPQPGAVILNEDGTWTRIPEAEQPVSEYTQTTEKVRLRIANHTPITCHCPCHTEENPS